MSFHHTLPLLPSYSEPIPFDVMVRERFLLPRQPFLDQYFPPDTSFPVFVYIRLDAPAPPDYPSSSTTAKAPILVQVFGSDLIVLKPTKKRV